jgi:hypothetical protein
VLGNNAFYTSEYIKDTIKLTKSIVIKNNAEALKYNEYVKIKHPTHFLDSDPRTWRYYKHLTGVLHQVDVPVVFVSVDNGMSVTLSVASMLIHRRSKSELLKFGIYYDELVARYPEQELYIKVLIAQSLFSDAFEIYELPDYTVIAYDTSLIEDNEHDLLPELQLRIDNYKNIWLIPYYALSSNLFLTSQYHILYNFIFTSLLSIRLGNAKTSRAHTFHIRLYLASHHNLDNYILFLTRKQQLFLYRNLLYLNNHAGINNTFRTLIDVLFSERNISVVNYVYNQKNELSDQSDTEYTYNQRLLNNKNLFFSKKDMSLEYVRDKEYLLAPGNAKEYDFGIERIDRTNKLSLYTKLLTKDLETILIDETDTVKHKLLDILTDYWAYLVKTNQMNFLVDFVDPVSNITKRLNTKDLFKLYTICLYRSQGISLEEFPEYRIKRVFRQTLPTKEQLLGFFYDPRIEYREELQTVLDAVPPYRPLITSFQFSEFIVEMYHLNIGLWSLTSNQSNIHTHGQMSAAIELMHQNELYVFDDETVDAFFSRTNVIDVRTYSVDQAAGLIFGMLDNLFDQRLSYQNRLRRLQMALTSVFFKFNSYTVQLINNYYSDSPIIAGVKDSRYDDKYIYTVDLVHDFIPTLLIEPTAQTRTLEPLWFNFETGDSYKNRTEIEIDVTPELDISVKEQSHNALDVVKSLLVDAQTVVRQVTQIDAEFSSRFYLEGTKIKSNIEFPVEMGFRVGGSTTVGVSESMTSRSSTSTLGQTWTDIQSSDPNLVFLAMNL